MRSACYLLAGILTLFGCATQSQLYQPQYSAKAIEAWVVDGETNQPLEGVTVLASWEVEAGAMKAKSKIYRIKLLEAVTDKNGRFFFPPWGPELNPSVIGYIGTRDPALIFFKSGYRYLGQENFGTLGRPGAVRYSDWDGKTIKMQKPTSDVDYLDRFGRLRDTLDVILASEEEPCNWKRAPKMVLAVLVEERRLRDRGLTNFPSLISRLRTSEDYFSRSGCGSVNAFLDNLSK